MPSNVYNSNWFAGNLVRKYPLDSMASCIDDTGRYLLDDIITDINISYPRSLGDYCHVSAVNVTKNLVSVLISVGTMPIAACCVSRPTDIDRYYTLDALYAGVAGVIAFGLDSIDTVGKWKFTNGENSRILPTCCTVYDPPTVLSLCRTNDASPMTGDILFTANNDIELATHKVLVDNKYVNAIFIGLKLDKDVLKKYITPCEIVTEADTCARRYVSVFGGAEPYCDGNIRIVSRRETIQINPLIDGVLVLSTSLTLEDMCGKRPRKYEDESDSSSSSSSSDWCPYKSPISPNICGKEASDSESESNISNVKLRKREVSPLITQSDMLDLSLNYINLYTSDIQVLSGGAVYGDGTGFINAEPDNVRVKTTIRDSKKVDIQLVTTTLSRNYADISIGTARFNVNKNAIEINNEPIDFNFTSKKHYHIIFTPDSILIEDENYNVLYSKECKNDLNYEISIENPISEPSDMVFNDDFIQKIDIFVELNDIKCETIAYE